MRGGKKFTRAPITKFIENNITDFKKYYPDVQLKYLNEGSNTIIYEFDSGSKVLKIPKKNTQRFQSYIEELNDIIVPIIDASWRRNSKFYWLMSYKVQLKRLNNEDLCKFILEILPIMIKRGVYFSDFGKNNITYFDESIINNEKEGREKLVPKIYDYDFTRADDNILYPFKNTKLRNTELFVKLKTNEKKLLGIALVIIRYWINQEIRSDKEYEKFIDGVCIEMNEDDINLETISKLVNNDITKEKPRAFTSDLELLNYYNPFCSIESNWDISGNAADGLEMTQNSNTRNNSNSKFKNITHINTKDEKMYYRNGSITEVYSGDFHTLCIYAATRFRVTQVEFMIHIQINSHKSPECRK
jgi:hypothetical protein